MQMINDVEQSINKIPKKMYKDYEQYIYVQIGLTNVVIA